MILALSLNTALDKTYVLGRLSPGVRHTPLQTLTLAGGKAVNAVRTLKLLGLRARILGMTAGSAGRHIESLLSAEGIAADWVRLPKGESRTCITLTEKRGRTLPTEVNELGPQVPPSAVSIMEELFRRRLPQCRFVLLCGRLAPGFPKDFYARLIRAASALGVPSALDTSEPALSASLRAGPDIVKPNRDEMAELGLSTARRDWRASLEALRKLGARQAYVTLGAQGALMLSGGQRLHAAAPISHAGSPIGCGDTFLAGIVYSGLKGWPADRRLAFATALASAGARTLGAGVFRRPDLEDALRRTRTRPI
ncbi:MAG: hypothetical protein A2X36_02675 [Elusimicrobia bacterium GWA2_69_24]|nr:MAG: hypothetical protein A2X36_02675 [Elusimicrobia bacterium GWA2_69_24]HBL15567.1 1-phosphofructokinase [Elusimicrobiota bacterium]